MSDDGASETYVSTKRRACAELGIASVHTEPDPTAPTETLLERIDEPNADPAVHGILVQLPLPEHADDRAVLERPRTDHNTCQRSG